MLTKATWRRAQQHSTTHNITPQHTVAHHNAQRHITTQASASSIHGPIHCSQTLATAHPSLQTYRNVTPPHHPSTLRLQEWQQHVTPYPRQRPADANDALYVRQAKLHICTLDCLIGFSYMGAYNVGLGNLRGYMECHVHQRRCGVLHMWASFSEGTARALLPHNCAMCHAVLKACCCRGTTMLAVDCTLSCCSS